MRASPRGSFEGEDGILVDDVCGGVLNAEMVHAACREGIGWCRNMKIWECVPRSRMIAAAAKAVNLRWVDRYTGTHRLNYMPMHCARAIKKALKKSQVPQAADLFIGMPPALGGGEGVAQHPCGPLPGPTKRRQGRS